MRDALRDRRVDRDLRNIAEHAKVVVARRILRQFAAPLFHRVGRLDRA